MKIPPIAKAALALLIGAPVGLILMDCVVDCPRAEIMSDGLVEIDCIPSKLTVLLFAAGGVVGVYLLIGVLTPKQ